MVDGKEQVAGKRGDGMAKRLAAMPLGIETEILVELLQAVAQHRNFLGRNAKRLARPEARVDADSLDTLPGRVADRHHDQVEWNPAVDGRLALGLGHERLLAAA